MHKCAWAVKVTVAVIICCYQVNCMNFVEQQTNRQVLTVHHLRIARYNASETVANLTLYMFPETAYNIRDDQLVNVSFAYTLVPAAAAPAMTGGGLNATFRSTDERVASVLKAHFVFDANFTADPALEASAGLNWTAANQTLASLLPYSIQVKGNFLGRADVTLAVQDPDQSTWGESRRSLNTSLRYRVSVIRKRRLIDDIVQFVMWGFVLLANTGMGCELDLQVVKRVLRKPVAPILGFVSQYLFMPMISFCILLIIDMPASTALGYFAMGCAPGGGASNFYCLLLGGDISLSITMTLISTLAALGMTPLYMLTLGQHILKSRNVEIKIPYSNILISLLLILIPTGIGYVIKVKLPRVGRILRKILKPVIVLFLVFIFTVGVYANLYIWQLMNPVIIGAGCALPYLGFILGGILAAVFCQPWPFIKTISLETGIQNPGVPILVLLSSLPQPDADLSLVGPVAAATFTPMPLLLWVLGRFLYYRFIIKRSMFQARPQSNGEQEVSGSADFRQEQPGVSDSEEVTEGLASHRRAAETGFFISGKGNRGGGSGSGGGNGSDEKRTRNRKGGSEIRNRADEGEDSV